METSFVRTNEKHRTLHINILDHTKKHCKLHLIGQHQKGTTTFKEQERARNATKHFKNASVYQAHLGCSVQEDSRKIEEVS